MFISAVKVTVVQWSPDKTLILETPVLVQDHHDPVFGEELRSTWDEVRLHFLQLDFNLSERRASAWEEIKDFLLLLRVFHQPFKGFNAKFKHRMKSEFLYFQNSAFNFLFELSFSLSLCTLWVPKFAQSFPCVCPPVSLHPECWSTNSKVTIAKFQWKFFQYIEFWCAYRTWVHRSLSFNKSLTHWVLMFPLHTGLTWVHWSLSCFKESCRNECAPSPGLSILCAPPV